MRLSSLNSLFIFNLPSDFIPDALSNKYQPLLDKNWVQYENVVDYLSSTIKEINMPGLSIETPEQTIRHGKKIKYKAAVVPQDIVSSSEIDITFRSVDGNINWIILLDIMETHYTDTDHLFVNPFIVTAIDINRDGIYDIKFKEIILKTISENRFQYQSNQLTENTFTVTFSFNYYEIDFLLNPSKILDTSDPWLPKITTNTFK